VVAEVQFKGPTELAMAVQAAMEVVSQWMCGLTKTLTGQFGLDAGN
jgi:hypothetical protein